MILLFAIIRDALLLRSYYYNFTILAIRKYIYESVNSKISTLLTRKSKAIKNFTNRAN